MMGFGTTLVIIVALLVLASILRKPRGAANPVPTDEYGNPLPTLRERELEAEIASLRERIQVLERIATDDRESRRLSAEIESLRDD